MKKNNGPLIFECFAIEAVPVLTIIDYIQNECAAQIRYVGVGEIKDHRMLSVDIAGEAFVKNMELKRLEREKDLNVQNALRNMFTTDGLPLRKWQLNIKGAVVKNVDITSALLHCNFIMLVITRRNLE